MVKMLTGSGARCRHQPGQTVQHSGLRASGLVCTTYFMLGKTAKRVDVRLPEKEKPNSHDERPFNLIITMIKWFWTSKLPMKNFLFGLTGGGAPPYERDTSAYDGRVAITGISYGPGLRPGPMTSGPRFPNTGTPRAEESAPPPRETTMGR